MTTNSAEPLVTALTEILFESPVRIIQDALTAATGQYWRRRAGTFDAARPRAGDFHGLNATPATIRALDDRIAAKAAACRARAYVSDLEPLSDAEQAEILLQIGGATSFVDAMKAVA